MIDQTELTRLKDAAREAERKAREARAAWDAARAAAWEAAGAARAARAAAGAALAAAWEAEDK